MSNHPPIDYLPYLTSTNKRIRSILTSLRIDPGLEMPEIETIDDILKLYVELDDGIHYPIASSVARILRLAGFKQEDAKTPLAELLYGTCFYFNDDVVEQAFVLQPITTAEELELAFPHASAVAYLLRKAKYI